MPCGHAAPRSRRSTCARPESVRALTVRGVHHVALICRDVEETIRFYQELLGFPLVELVENRDYAGSSHFFFDIGNGNLLGFFDFPGHDHPDFTETIGAVQHLALSTTAEEFAAATATARRGRASRTSARTAESTTASTSATRTAWASSSTARSSACSKVSRCSTAEPGSPPHPGPALCVRALCVRKATFPPPHVLKVAFRTPPDPAQQQHRRPNRPFARPAPGGHRTSARRASTPASGARRCVSFDQSA